METHGVAAQTHQASPPKRPRGRPRKPQPPELDETTLDALAQQAPDEPALDVAGGIDYGRPFQHLKPASFFRFCADYPNQEATSTYLYRVYPRIDRRLAGHTTKYVQKWAGPTTEAEVKRQWGSGDYRLIFVDANSPRNLAQRAYCQLSIEDPQFPPVVPLDELVLDHQRNAGYVQGLKARGLLGADPMNKPDGGAPAVAELAGTVKDLCGIIASRSAAPAAPAAANPESLALNTALVGGLTTLTKTLVDVASRSAQAPPAPDPLELLDKTLGRLKDMGLLAPASGGRAVAADGFSWSEFMRAAPAIVGGIAQLMVVMNGLRQPAAAPAPGAAPASLPAAVPGELPELPEGEVDMMSPAVLGALQEVGRRAMEAFKLDVDGDAFAAALCKTPRGERAYDLLHQLGTAGVLQAVQMIPGLAEQLAPARENLERFLADFMAYGDPPAPGGQGEEVQP